MRNQDREGEKMKKTDERGGTKIEKEKERKRVNDRER